MHQEVWGGTLDSNIERRMTGRGQRYLNITSSSEEVNIHLDDELEGYLQVPPINSELNFLNNYLLSEMKAFNPFKTQEQLQSE